ncbi:MAG: hypothetical protein U0640_14255 [Phycisphaerales bacterium]
MTLSRSVVLSSVVLSTFAGAALADHNHMTVDTIPGTPQNQILIRAGYYPAESAFSISGGRLQLNGDIAVYDVVDELAQTGPLNGWLAGDELLLTSDFYFATGRLDGGNFMWELSSVTALSGGPASLVWGDFDLSGEFTPMADSTAATRLGRSFDTMIAGHDHEQGYAFSTPGLYDVTFIAWDSNGVYADSAPVTVRFDVVPAPGAAALLGLGGLLAARRRRA